LIVPHVEVNTIVFEEDHFSLTEMWAVIEVKCVTFSASEKVLTNESWALGDYFNAFCDKAIGARSKKKNRYIILQEIFLILADVFQYFSKHYYFSLALPLSNPQTPPDVETPT
jgi:hypothetical protein